MVNYHYMVSNNKIAPIFDQIRTAVQPSKFTYDFLKNIGFTSSNDRAIIVVLKNLDFLNSEGFPTANYKDLKDTTRAKKILAQKIRSYYCDLFSINTNMNAGNETEIKGAISRVTGKEEKDVKRMYATFKALCNYADFSNINTEVNSTEENAVNHETPNATSNSETNENSKEFSLDFHYNIQIHLPATTDISVYNAIFKSLKDNLFK